jgi:hypothetical protein
MIYAKGKSDWHPLERRLSRLQNKSGYCGVENNLLPLLDNEL